MKVLIIILPCNYDYKCETLFSQCNTLFKATYVHSVEILRQIT